MAKTDINSEDRLVQATFAEHLESVLGWEGVYAFNNETFGSGGTLGREDTKEVVLKRDLRAAVDRLNPELPAGVREEAVAKLTRHDFSRSLIQHNREFYGWLRDGVPVDFRDEHGEKREVSVRVIDFKNCSTDGFAHNRFLAVREMKFTGLRAPHYNRRRIWCAS